MKNYSTELIVINDKLYFKTEQGLELAPLSVVVNRYRTMQANLEWFIGLTATDQPDRVIDPENVMFLLNYDEIPENNIWIK